SNTLDGAFCLDMLGDALGRGTPEVFNLIGCLVIGLLAELAEARGAFTPETRAFVFIGILGGFTTSSSFSHRTLNRWRGRETVLALLNVAAHVVLGLAAVWLGRVLGHLIWG